MYKIYIHIIYTQAYTYLYIIWKLYVFGCIYITYNMIYKWNIAFYHPININNSNDDDSGNQLSLCYIRLENLHL